MKTMTGIEIIISIATSLFWAVVGSGLTLAFQRYFTEDGKQRAFEHDRQRIIHLKKHLEGYLSPEVGSISNQAFTERLFSGVKGEAPNNKWYETYGKTSIHLITKIRNKLGDKSYRLLLDNYLEQISKISGDSSQREDRFIILMSELYDKLTPETDNYYTRLM